MFSFCANNKKTDIPASEDGLLTPASLVISQGDKRPLAEAWNFDTLVFDKRIHIDNDTTKAGMKVGVSFVYPVSSPENIDLRKVQQTFSKIFTNKKNFSGTIKEAFDTIVNNYVSNAIEYGKDWEEEDNEFISFSNFEENTETSVDHVSRYVITVSSGGYSYLGGAHGMYGIGYDNIDLRDGDIIDENKLFNPEYESKLAELIQDVVTERNNSSNEDGHIMLLVEIPEIKSNDNFILSDEGIVYIYNQYEISPYVQGIVEITVPYDKVKPLIKNKYIEVIEDIQSK